MDNGLKMLNGDWSLVATGWNRRLATHQRRIATNQRLISEISTNSYNRPKLVTILLSNWVIFEANLKDFAKQEGNEETKRKGRIR